ncbi:DUF6221 family protein [Streptomyces sp. ME18-1-4]|uniref:DUF6221 family protein n=1 Tax=Streptomyces sp. ME18-1-4 TaxID=3028685 RepID=UPI0029A21F0B|nr:DUF6221 family protein [Streptomyces sp. ME18-1-4]MDX3247174.1 DUF6221 family protein [Streptomyces sp. ME18-1-4]
MSADLVVWLRAQLDEDERIARRAGDTFRQIGETGVIVATEGDRAEECASANWAGVAEHVVRHDPARVLREIDAKRRLLTELLPDLEHADRLIEGEWGSGDDLATRALRLLALPYADQPGYLESWRP